MKIFSDKMTYPMEKRKMKKLSCTTTAMKEVAAEEEFFFVDAI